MGEGDGVPDGGEKGEVRQPRHCCQLLLLLKKTMFGANQDVPLEEMGEQKEWDAKRALVTRNLQAIEGTLQEPSSYRQPGDRDPLRLPARARRQGERERERERERKGSGRESSRTGDGDSRQSKASPEAEAPDRIAPEGGDERERLPRHGDDELLHRSRSAREAASRTGVRVAEAPTARSSETPGDVSFTGDEIAPTMRHVSAETGGRGKMGPWAGRDESQSERAGERTRDRRRESDQDR